MNTIHNHPVKLILTGITLVGVFLLWGCGGHTKQPEKAEANGFDLLIGYIEKQADFVNSEEAPGAIGIDAVLNYAGKNLLVLDLRTPREFDEGHLSMAVNKPMEEVLPYFEGSIDPGSYDTIALISDDGQDAMYATTLLRLLGYNNVFAVRFGMGWHKQLAKKYWEPFLSSSFESRLVTDPSPSKKTYPYPTITLNSADAYTALQERITTLLASGRKHFTITGTEVFANPEAYYIINYWPDDEYLAGHIPGAIRYSPRTSLSRSTELGTLPTDKPVVIYCHQANLSSSAAAYLRLLGYDARSLSYGANGFMYNLLRNKIGKGFFDPDALIDYPLSKEGDISTGKQTPPVVKVKSQGGC